jgi:hypothetical protein
LSVTFVVLSVTFVVGLVMMSFDIALTKASCSVI